MQPPKHCNSVQKLCAHVSWQVFLLERDGPLYDSNASSSSPALPDLQDIRARRKGVPQFQQPHVLLKRGLDEMEKLLPGVQQTLLDSGRRLGSQTVCRQPCFVDRWQLLSLVP